MLVEYDIAGKSDSVEVRVEPVRKVLIFILPHSHHDLGYTDLQSNVEEKQMANISRGIELARNTANYPPGARFVWNLEVLWGADQFMRTKTEAERQELISALRKGWIGLNGMYANELTGLCRPEELLQLFRYSTELGSQCGIRVDAAMISDVPGYTWGTVTAMAQAGIKYFSAAPNNFDRIGQILREWENKPFYWVGSDGKSKVLIGIPFWGYALSHRYDHMSPRLVDEMCDSLAQRKYAYDIAYVRWAGHGDNGAPDPEICDFIKDWNNEYAWPKFIISGTSEAFRAFEQRHGNE